MDSDIISLISKKSEEKEIYLDFYNSEYVSVFFVHSEVNGEHIMEFEDFWGYHKTKINKEDLAYDYILLSEAFKNASYLGYKEYIVALGKSYFVLYELQQNNRKKYLILDNKGYQLTESPVGYTVEGIASKIYQDKEYVQKEYER